MTNTAIKQRLISTNELVRKINKLDVFYFTGETDIQIHDCQMVELGAVLAEIDETTTVDAVEVIRCEKCKHAVWDEENEMWKCVESAEYDEKLGEWFGFYEYHNGDFFCALGERMCGE